MEAVEAAAEAAEAAGRRQHKENMMLPDLRKNSANGPCFLLCTELIHFSSWRDKC